MSLNNLSLSSRCEFWNALPDACRLKAGSTTFISSSISHTTEKTGNRSPDCDGVNPECKTKCKEILQAKLQEIEEGWKESVAPSSKFTLFL